MPASKEAGTRRSRSGRTQERSRRGRSRSDERENERADHDAQADDEYDDYDEESYEDDEADDVVEAEVVDDSYDEDDDSRGEEQDEDAEADRAPRRRKPARQRKPSAQRKRHADGRMATAKVARVAMTQIAELTGKQPESVTSVSRAEDGWDVGVEVIEDRRIPSSSDLMAIYEAQIDADGELMSYQRVRRYARGRGDSGGES